MDLIIVRAFLLFTLFSFIHGQTDLTLIPRAKGKDVTEAVIRKIKRSAIFDEDSGFSRRAAWVESTFGDDEKTYRDGYFGGIWQADERIYNQTKNSTAFPQLINLFIKIRSYFGIDWNTSTWSSLQTPLYSGLAFHLFFAGVLNEPIPGTLNNQSALWKREYNRNDSLTQPHFVSLIKELEKEPVCRGRMDICIVLDGSGSVQRPNFIKALGFIRDLVATFEIGPENVKTGFVEYSTGVRTVFPVENTYNKTTLERMINNTNYNDGGSTNTPGGIYRAVALLKNVTYRSGVPKIMTVLTDGQSNIGDLPAAIRNASQSEINSFAVGIGNGVVREELLQIAYDDPTRVFEMTDFDALAEFFYRLNTETCTTPQTPETNETVTDTLIQGERRYYFYSIPQEGMTVKIGQTKGSTTAYYSYTEEIPSSAINDGMVEGGKLFYIPRRVTVTADLTIINPGQSFKLHQFGRNGESVFIGIEGVGVENEYKMEILDGNQVPSSSTRSVASAAIVTLFAVFFSGYGQVQ